MGAVALFSRGRAGAPDTPDPAEDPLDLGPYAADPTMDELLEQVRRVLNPEVAVDFVILREPGQPGSVHVLRIVDGEGVFAGRFILAPGNDDLDPAGAARAVARHFITTTAAAKPLATAAPDLKAPPPPGAASVSGAAVADGFRLAGGD